MKAGGSIGANNSVRKCAKYVCVNMCSRAWIYLCQNHQASKHERFGLTCVTCQVGIVVYCRICQLVRFSWLQLAIGPQLTAVPCRAMPCRAAPPPCEWYLQEAMDLAMACLAVGFQYKSGQMPRLQRQGPRRSCKGRRSFGFIQKT